DAVSAATDEERLVKIHDVIQQLPPPHYRTLEFLMRHLARLADYCSITNMHTKNLAIVWAPNLLRSKQIESACFSGTAAFMEVRIQSVVVEFILNHVDVLFSSKLSSVIRDGAGHSSLSRPKSLLVSSPSTKLLTLEEAQARTQAQINSPIMADSKYIEVGEGPAALQGKFHTVIDFPSERKRPPSKMKKSPVGSWRSFFNLGKSSSVSKRKLQRNPSEPSEMKAIALAGGRGDSGTLRSAKSEESLTSLHAVDGAVALDSPQDPVPVSSVSLIPPPPPKNAARMLALALAESAQQASAQSHKRPGDAHAESTNYGEAEAGTALEKLHLSAGAPDKLHLFTAVPENRLHFQPGAPLEQDCQGTAGEQNHPPGAPGGQEPPPLHTGMPGDTPGSRDAEQEQSSFHLSRAGDKEAFPAHVGDWERAALHGPGTLPERELPGTEPAAEQPHLRAGPAGDKLHAPCAAEDKLQSPSVAPAGDKGAPAAVPPYSSSSSSPFYAAADASFCDLDPYSTVRVRPFHGLPSREFGPYVSRLQGKGLYRYPSLAAYPRAGLINHLGKEHSFVSRDVPPAPDIKHMYMSWDLEDMEKYRMQSIRRESRTRQKVKGPLMSQYDNVAPLLQDELGGLDAVHLRSKSDPGKSGLLTVAEGKEGRYPAKAATPEGDERYYGQHAEPELDRALYHGGGYGNGQPEKPSLPQKQSSIRNRKMHEPGGSSSEHRTYLQQEANHRQPSEPKNGPPYPEYRPKGGPEPSEPMGYQHSGSKYIPGSQETLRLNHKEGRLAEDRPDLERPRGRASMEKHSRDCYKEEEHAAPPVAPPPKPERSHSLRMREHPEPMERDSALLYPYQTLGKRQSTMTVVSQYDNLEDYHTLPQHQRGGYAGAGGFVPPGFPHVHSRTYATALGQGAFLPTELCLQRPETEVHVE
ncbi:hypothetical protein EK904_004861, partial [Melospiza melodia maxima]